MRTLPTCGFDCPLLARRFITDAHWVPQSEHCSLSPRRGNATLPFFRMLRMSSPTFHKELDAVFAEAGFDPSLRQAYFPEQSGAHHRTGARSRLAAYYDRPTARRAIEIYQRDYEAFGLPLPDLREFVRVKSLKQSGDHFDGFQTMWVHASRVSIHDPTTGEYENIYAGLIDAGEDTAEDDEKQKKKVMGKVEQKFNECGGRQKRSWFEMNEEERKEIRLEWGKIQKKRLKATQAEQSMGGSSK